MARFALPALLLLSACASRPPLPGIAPEAVLHQIGDLEDARILDAAFLSMAAAHERPAVRERTALALGRLMKPEAIPLLEPLLRDPDPLVRKAALFAAGQLNLRPDGLSPAEIGRFFRLVLEAMRDRDDSMRATAVEAMGKLAMENAPGLAVPLLKDPSPAVRRQAASACFRWRQILRWRSPDAKPPDPPKAAIDALSAAADDSDPEVRWRAVHALLRSGAKPSAAAVKRFIEDSEPLARVFALNLVERHKLQELSGITAQAQLDSDAQVRQASVRALNALDQPDFLHKKLVSDPSYHVREAVAELLVAAGPELEMLSKDESTAVRSMALRARVRILKEESLTELGRAMADGNPLLRIAAVKGAGDLKLPGLPLLLKARDDEAEEVRAAALVPMAEIEDPRAWASILRGLSAPGLGERGNAATALEKRKEPGVVAAAVDCFRGSAAREWVEVRESIVDLLGGQPPEATTTFLLDVARSDAAPSVRQKAVSILRQRGVRNVPDAPAAPVDRTPHVHLRFAANPTVVMETTKGTMEIECFAREAPVHVANFVGLVEKGFYDGLAWHRVVPNFVIQGGDPLGNGWGDAGWSLRAEINTIPYRRGTLGMPRSAGFDTGGSQLFFTHLPTPHLDGYYTVFGQVVKGLDVLDRIEIGDRILRATAKR